MSEQPIWDGIPPNSTQSGWHWLRHKSGNDISPWRWADGAGREGVFTGPAGE